MGPPLRRPLKEVFFLLRGFILIILMVHRHDKMILFNLLKDCVGLQVVFQPSLTETMRQLWRCKNNQAKFIVYANVTAKLLRYNTAHPGIESSLVTYACFQCGWHWWNFPNISVVSEKNSWPHLLTCCLFLRVTVWNMFGTQQLLNKSADRVEKCFRIQWIKLVL